MSEIWNVVGVSSIVAIIITFLFDVVKNKMTLRFEKLTIEKEQRYRSILVFMSVLVDINNYEHIETTYRPRNCNNQEILDYYRKEIELHRNFCYLFASKEVIDCMTFFIENSSDEQYKKTATAMRKDLWNNKL